MGKTSHDLVLAPIPGSRAVLVIPPRGLNIVVAHCEVMQQGTGCSQALLAVQKITGLGSWEPILP